MPAPFSQSSYQVRLEWAVTGLARLAPADVVIVVDVLRFSSTMADAVAAGHRIRLDDARGWSTNGAAVAAAAAASAGSPMVLLGGIRNASATARAVRTAQERAGRRTSVSVIAAGEHDGAQPRIAVEDQLGAGAVIDALSAQGIDHSSPEAALAGESFRALRRGLRHLLVGSGSGRELADGVASTERMLAAGIRPASIAEAAEVDAVDAVPHLRDGVFAPFA